MLFPVIFFHNISVVSLIRVVNLLFLFSMLFLLFNKAWNLFFNSSRNLVMFPLVLSECIFFLRMIFFHLISRPNLFCKLLFIPVLTTIISYIKFCSYIFDSIGFFSNYKINLIFCFFISAFPGPFMTLSLSKDYIHDCYFVSLNIL